MKKETVQREVFIADDGQKFDDEKDCEIYESKIELLRKLKNVKLMEKNFYTIFIEKGFEENVKDMVKEIFKVKNPDIIKDGWNLLYDGGDDSICFPIEDLMKRITEPTPREPKKPVITETELQGIAQIKLKLKDILKRAMSPNGSPEGKLGQLIMEIQELIAGVNV